MRKVHLYEPLNLFGTACNGKSSNPKTSLMWEDVDCGSCRKTDVYRYAKSNQIKQEVLEMSSVKKSCQNCVSCIDDKCINVYNESGRIDMFDASHCAQWKDKNNFSNLEKLEKLEKEIAQLRKALQTYKQHAELIGLPVGTSDTSLENAKRHADDFEKINIVQVYNGRYYVLENGDTYQYAYPVSSEKLAQLKQELEK